MTDWLKLSAPLYCEEGIDAMAAYLEDAPGNMDPEAPRALFEAAVAQYLGVPREWVLATNSGTAALTVACRAVGGTVEAGALTWPATYAHGAKRRVVDVRADAPVAQWTEESGTVRVPVALWGIRAELPPRAPGNRVVVDAAHAFGQHIDDLRAGRADAVCYSFGPLKEVPCSRGGALVSLLCAQPTVRALADSGTVGRHGIVSRGFNLEMGEPEAVLGLCQLKYARAWWEARQALLRAYAAYWSESGSGMAGRLLTRAVEPGEAAGGASGHVCVALADSPTVRMRWQAALLANRVQCGIHYETPLWAPATRFPCSWDWSQRILSLPLHLGMGEATVRRVVGLLAGAQ